MLDMPEIEKIGVGYHKLSKIKGKLLISHRYNLIPLLHSCPGGVHRELVVQDLPFKGKNTIILLDIKQFLTSIFMYICKKKTISESCNLFYILWSCFRITYDTYPIDYIWKG